MLVYTLCLGSFGTLHSEEVAGIQVDNLPEQEAGTQLVGKLQDLPVDMLWVDQWGRPPLELG